MSNVNTLIYDKTIHRAAMIRLYEERITGKVSVVIDGHSIRVDDLIKKSKLQKGGFDTFMKLFDKELAKTMKEIHTVSSRSLIDLVTSQISFVSQNIEAAAGKIWRTARPNRRIAEDIVLNKPLYGNTVLAAGWSNISLAERKRLEGMMRKGLAEGLSESEIALSIRKGNIFNITRNQAKGLIVTATTSVHSQIDQEVYKANEKLLKGWQYVAVLDSRTTALCAFRDGTIYPVNDVEHLPPAHFHCRSTTIPIVKTWDDLRSADSIAQIRKRNLANLSPKQIAYYDGQSPMKESYSEWLSRQPTDIQFIHLGSLAKVKAFQTKQITVDKFVNPYGTSIGIQELSKLTSGEFNVPRGQTRKFAMAKQQLDTIKLGATHPEELIESKELTTALRDYYVLQSRELGGNLSYTNYRGALMHTKKAMKQKVINVLPTEANLKYNPLTGRYEDARMYQPSPETLKHTYSLIDESQSLLPKDKAYIKDFVDSLQDLMSVNERSVISENLRIVFSRYRDNKELWGNLKAVLNSEIPFDVMNVSDYMETQIRKDSNLLYKLKQSGFIDPVLGPTQLDMLHNTFIDSIQKRNNWEDKELPQLASRLRGIIDTKIPIKIKARLGDSDTELRQFYLKFARRLAMADTPDRDQFAAALGKDLYNAANLKGSRNEWWKLGTKLLDDAKGKGIFDLDTYGIQKRRMKSRMGNRYFGPYYDTFSVHLKISDPKIIEYATLNRKIDVGLRVGPLAGHNKLLIRKGYKTYFLDQGLRGMYDTRIPIISSSSFYDFPVELIDDAMTKALNWASSTEYKVDPEFYDFIDKLIMYVDDKGKAEYYDDLNNYKKYMISRGDSYERLKAMSWLRNKDAPFTNLPFLDHRGRIYERGMIGPQSGETFRPFLNTSSSKKLGADGFYNLQDQIGSFFGGLSDEFEGNFNSLSQTGRQKIAIKLRKDLVDIGNHMLRGKPADIRFVLEHPMVLGIDGEEQGKALRLAMEMAKIDRYLSSDYSNASIEKLAGYDISLALEQDASSSGAQIIALTTRNKQLAELSNVLPTNYKKRLYDEIAAATYNDSRFIALNEKLGLTEKDLRKAAKAQNMVTFN